MLLFFLATGSLRAQCTYTLILNDTYGDGWNGGTLTITNGSNSQGFTLIDGFTDTTTFTVVAGQPLQFTWLSGFFVNEVSFVILNNIGEPLLEVDPPSDGTLLSIPAAECLTCLSPTDFKVENVYDTRVKLRWSPNPESISPAQEWMLIYGVRGFIPENKVGDTLKVLQPKATITGLQKKSEYDVYLMQKCQDGNFSKRVGPLPFKTYWTNDVGISSVETPLSGCDLSQSETVSIRLSNFGSAPQSLIPFRYYVNGQDGGVQQPNDGFYTGVLGKDSTVLIPFEALFDFSEPGEYRIDVVTEMNGDEDILNDTFTYYLNNRLPAPYTQGFEVWDGGWTVDADGSDRPSWAFGTPQKTLIGVAASGDNAWFTGQLDSLYNFFEKSYLVSPCFDFGALTEDPAFECSVIYDTEDDSDGAWLEMSTDEGQTWVKVGTATTGINWYNSTGPAVVGDFWSGISAGWEQARTILTGAAGKSSVRLRFAFFADGFDSSEGFGVDDIRIDVTNATDLAANTIKTEGQTNAPCGKALDKVIFTYSNFGSTALAAVQLAYAVNGGTPVVATPTLPALQPGQSATFTFPTTFDSRDKRFEIKCWVTATGDQSVFNDTTTYVIDNRPRALPFSENFDASFFAPVDWDFDTGFITQDHGNNPVETNVYAVNLYSGNPTFSLVAPRVGLLDADNSKLRFSYRLVDFTTETLPIFLPTGTKIDVQASKDCGTTFQNIYSINTTTHDLVTSMQKVNVNLTGFNNEDIQVRFRGTLGLLGSALDIWFDLDSVEIVSCAGGFDIAANVLAPVSGQTNGQAALTVGGGTAPYTFAWSNGATTQSIDNLPLGPVSVTVTDANGCTETLVVQVGTSGTGEVEGLTNVALFPNPTRGAATLQMSFDVVKTVNIELLDLLGRQLYATQVQPTDFVNQDIDVNMLPAGVYMLRVEVEGQVLTRKLVKE
jgi:hypothetical protein